MFLSQTIALVLIGYLSLTSSVFAQDADLIHDNCVLITESVLEGHTYEIGDTEYGNYSSCFHRVFPDARTQSYGDGSIPEVLIPGAAYEDPDNLGNLKLNTSIIEGVVDKGYVFKPGVSDDTPVFLRLAPSGEGNEFNYEAVVGIFTPAIGDGIIYQLSNSHQGNILDSDGDKSEDTRALMIPLASLGEFQSYINNTPIFDNVLLADGKSQVLKERGIVYCPRFETDLPFGKCSSEVTINELEQKRIEVSYVRVEYCSWIPVWRLKPGDPTTTVPGIVEFVHRTSSEQPENYRGTIFVAKELLLLQNNSDNTGTIRPPCTRTVQIFPNLQEPKIWATYRVRTEDHGRLHNAFFADKDHVTWGYKHDNNYTWSSSSKSYRYFNSMTLFANEAWNTNVRKSWYHGGNPRIKVLNGLCCDSLSNGQSSNGGMYAEGVFADLENDGNWRNKVVSLRDTTIDITTAPVELLWDTDAQQWLSDDATITVSPAVGLSTYEWLVGGQPGTNFMPDTGETFLPIDFEGPSFDITEVTQNFHLNQYYMVIDPLINDSPGLYKFNACSKGNQVLEGSADTYCADVSYICNARLVAYYAESSNPTSQSYAANSIASSSTSMVNKKGCWYQPQRPADRPYLSKNSYDTWQGTLPSTISNGGGVSEFTEFYSGTTDSKMLSGLGVSYRSFVFPATEGMLQGPGTYENVIDRYNSKPTFDANSYSSLLFSSTPASCFTCQPATISQIYPY